MDGSATPRCSSPPPKNRHGKQSASRHQCRAGLRNLIRVDQIKLDDPRDTARLRIDCGSLPVVPDHVHPEPRLESKHRQNCHDPGDSEIASYAGKRIQIEFSVQSPDTTHVAFLRFSIQTSGAPVGPHRSRTGHDPVRRERSGTARVRVDCPKNPSAEDKRRGAEIASGTLERPRDRRRDCH